MDKWYPLKCKIALAKELDVPPDDLLVEPVLEMVEIAQFYGESGELNANLMPDNAKQEEAVANQYYPEIIGRIFNNEKPFEGFLDNSIHERGI